jgi:integration host factor subunit beta
MIKSELIQRLAEQNPHLFAKDLEKAVNAFFDAIVATLASGDRLELRGIGTFGVKTWSARPGRNPKTGHGLNVPEKRHPYFKTGKVMHRRLNRTEDKS